MAQFKVFFKRITGDISSYDALTKQPIPDAEQKLKIFTDSTLVSTVGLENYNKSMSKSIDQLLADKFSECKDTFSRYDRPNDQILGTVLGKISEIQRELQNDVNDLMKNIDLNVLKPLYDYQKEFGIVKDNKKELKDAYDKIEQCRINLEKARKDVDNVQRVVTQQSHKMSSSDSSTFRKSNDLTKLEEKVSRIEKDLEDATSLAGEKYDKYTESLYKRIADECELTKCYLNYLHVQKKYHKRALKRLDTLIPDIDDTLKSYHKKPVFGHPLDEYVQRSIRSGSISQHQQISPVIKKLIDGMCKQNAFNEEGLFRIAGSRVKMNCLLYAINAGYLDYLDLANDFDIHCLAGVLKQYIRELPDSILCNDLCDEWIAAIKYLIKFLSKVVENSEKTKMTTSNMGICFGVSLLSNNGLLNSSNSTSNVSLMNSSMSGINQADGNNSGIGSSSSHSNKSIDMATATNVFDFILTNHNELLPGDVAFPHSPNMKPNFYHQNSTASYQPASNYSTLSKATGSFINQSPEQQHSNTNTTTNNTNTNTTSSSSSSSASVPPAVVQRNFKNNHTISENSGLNNDSPGSSSNRFSVIINDTLSNSEQPFPRPFGGFSSPSSSSSSNNNNSNISNLNRHVKKGSMDFRHIENDFTGNNSNNSSSNNNTTTNNNSSIKSNAQSSSSNQEPGSTSPRQRSKKQAPAPPPIASKPILQIESPSSLTSSSSSSSTSHAASSNNTGTSSSLSTSTPPSSNLLIGPTLLSVSAPPPLPNTAPQVINNESTSTNPNSLFPKLATTNSIRSSANNNNNNNETLLLTQSPSISPTTQLVNSKSQSQSSDLPNGHHNQQQPSSSSSSSSSTSNLTTSTTTILEKPNQPPPTVPNRPPPIGFNLSHIQSDSPLSSTINDFTNSSLLINNNNNNNNNNNINNTSITSSLNQTAPILLSSSTLSTASSSSSSSSQEMLSSPNNTLTKGPKPAVPRRPGSIFSSHLSKFQHNKQPVDDLNVDHHNININNNNNNNINEEDDGAHSGRSPSEITSL